MRKFIDGIKSDAKFIKDHELQPGWYKILKVFLIAGLIVGHFLLYGLVKTLVFMGCFFSLSLVVHIIYRINTHQFTQSWLDFIVEVEDGISKPKRIGIYYYLAVATNGIISLIVSQLLVK